MASSLSLSLAHLQIPSPSKPLIPYHVQGKQVFVCVCVCVCVSSRVSFCLSCGQTTQARKAQPPWAKETSFPWVPLLQLRLLLISSPKFLTPRGFVWIYSSNSGQARGEYHCVAGTVFVKAREGGGGDTGP